MISDEALAYGFVQEPVGTHISKTMMLRELGLLLEASDPKTDYAALRSLVIDDNVLLKQTASNRRETFSRLSQLYGLREAPPLYHALRYLYVQAPEELPLLALLCAVARDPLLRCTATWILDLREGEPVLATNIQPVVAAVYPGRYSAATLRSLGENIVSTWKQSGHLVQQERHKVRGRARIGPAATAYALFLGHLCGERGQPLFETLWARLLDAPMPELYEHAFAASQRGWNDYRHAGQVVDIGFSQFLALGQKGPNNG